MKTTIAHALLPAAAALCCAGCMTDFMQESRDQNQRTQTDVSYLKQDVDVLRQRLDALERNQEEVLGRVDAAGKSSRGDLDSTRVKLQDLEARIAAVDEARQRDRQQIVDAVSRQVADLLKRAAPPPPPPRTGPTQPAQRTGEYGREHVVKRGETLSAIASAYGVKVDAILKANNMTNANMLREGQKLFIPE